MERRLEPKHLCNRLPPVLTRFSFTGLRGIAKIATPVPLIQKLSLMASCGILSLFTLIHVCSASSTKCQDLGLAQYAGKYLPDRWNDEGFVSIYVRDGSLMFAPTFWRPARLLVPLGGDSFQLENFQDRQINFLRDKNGCVVALTTKGTPFPGRLQRVGLTTVQPLELLEQGKIQEALPALLEQSSRELPKLVTIGQALMGIPSQIPNTVQYFAALHDQFPKSAKVSTALADAQIAAGERNAARISLHAALEADPNSSDARHDLEMLGDLGTTDTGGGWQLPFALDDVFKRPSEKEILKVAAAWAERDLSIQALRVLSVENVTINGTGFELRVVSYLVHGVRTVGVILMPDGARQQSTPLLIEAKGVHWPFHALEVPGGLSLVNVMGKDLGKFIIVAPAFRGEELIANGSSFKSEGDQWDAFDGATDDLLAMLNIAMTLPETDPHRVCVFGRSRGGTVALLSGIRDSRVKCVAAWAAPTDWFQLMGQQGWTVEELVAAGLRNKSQPSEVGGQDIGFFLRSALENNQSLSQVREHMIASSPLYFSGLLPLTQIHYGIDDGIVPQRNGRELLLAWQRASKPNECLSTFFHQDAGHDQDVIDAPRQTKEFIMRSVGFTPDGSKISLGSCR